MTQIFGIVPVKNEDIFIERVVSNIVDFCDDVLVLDNNSTDNTYEIVDDLTKKHSNIHLMSWPDVRTTGQPIQHLVGEDCWVFGVDGDEIYDPVGLATMRKDILDGKYSDVFDIKGSFLHCNHIDEETKTVSGWLDAKYGDKLYNFSHLQYWNMSIALHGARLHKNGDTHMDANGRIFLSEEKGGEYAWEDCPLRSVHTCFLRRSSADPEDMTSRQHPLAEPGYKENKYIGKKIIKKHAPFI